MNIMNHPVKFTIKILTFITIKRHDEALEEQWYRGINEAIWERVETPSLNRNGGLPLRLSSSVNLYADVTRAFNCLNVVPFNDLPETDIKILFD